MAVDAGLAGRTLAPTPPYDVSRSAIAAFAAAIGSDDPQHLDVDAARAAGHADVVAPLTFPIVVAFQAMQALLVDPQAGIELRNVVHAQQRFEYQRAVRAGDVLTATLTVESVRRAAGTDLLATRSDIHAADGELVCTAYASLAHRQPQ
jgi:acyl dehydratase